MPSARKKSRRSAESIVVAEKPGFWEAKAAPFVQAHARLLAVLLIAIGTLRIVATYPETGITFDEPGHMACGLQFLAQHVYRYETQHPPLARVLSALGPYLDGARPTGDPKQDREGVIVMYRNGQVLRTLILMRLGILAFFPLCGLVVYLWTARYFGKLMAVMATGLFSLLPPVLAHAGLATTDMALTTCLGAAFYALVVWAETPGLRQSLVLGGVTGLMVLSKFTALAFLPAAVLLALAAYLAIERPGWGRLGALAKRRTAPFGLAVLTGALVIWAGYGFSFGKVPGWSVPLPAPEVFDGVRSALHHNSEGHPAYLFGEVSETGWWYYFPVVLSVKTPMAFLVLLAFGAYVCWQHRRRVAYCIPWALSLGILIPAMMGRVNIGVRHILPVYIGFSIAAALGAGQLLAWGRKWKWAGGGAGLLALWMVVSGASQHPNYLAYFNELAGSHPENILADSDLDWGQDTVRLARRLREMGVTECSFTTFNLNAQQLRAWPGVPSARLVNPKNPYPGWSVVSPTFVVLVKSQFPNLRPWYDYLQPVGKVGSLTLYYVPAELAQPKS